MKKLILLLATFAPLYSHAMHRPYVRDERVVCHTAQEIADQIVHYENLSAERASELMQVLRQCVEDNLLCYPPVYKGSKYNKYLCDPYWNNNRGYERTITVEALTRLMPFITIGGEPFFEQVLAVAIKEGEFEKAKVLVKDLHVNVNAFDTRGESIDKPAVPISMLQLATWQDDKKALPILNLVLQDRPNTEIILAEFTTTPLGRQLDDIQELYAYYDPNGRDLERKNNMLAKIELLLQSGASPDAVDIQKRSAIERLEYNYRVMEQKDLSPARLQDQRELINKVHILLAGGNIAERQEDQADDLVFGFEEHQEIEAQNWPQVAGALEPILTADELLAS